MAVFEKQFILSAIICFICLHKEIKANTLCNSMIEEEDNFMPHILNQVLENDIKRSMNTTADPCEDFYAYSCGNYNGYPDSSEESVREITQYLDHKYNKQLIKLLQAKTDLGRSFSETKSKQTFQEKILNYYQACVRENPANFVKYFEELQIKWALLPEECVACWGLRSNHFWHMLGQLQGYNWNNLIIRHEITASKNGSLNIILQPAYNNEHQPSNLPADIVVEGILKALKVDNATEVVQQLKVTQQKWLEIFQNNTMSEYIETEMSLMEVTVEYPSLRSYLRKLLSHRIHKLDKIFLRNVSFFRQLDGIQWTINELHLQFNYLIVHFLFYLFEDSSRKFAPHACIIDLRNKLDMAVNYIYYEEIYSRDYWLYEDGFDRINQQLVHIIQQIFEENNLNLNFHQIQDLKAKVHSIQINLGNLPYPVLSETIETFYEDIPNLDNKNYFKNHLILLQQRFRKSLLYSDDLNFFVTADNSLGSSSSMFYVHNQNLMVVPFASLQYPLCHYMFKPLYQMSLMGFIMAHEMGHAFDKNELMTTGLDSIVDQDLYKKSLECMQNQHPTNDIDERIADLFGERAAYRTYETFYNAVNNTNWQRQFYLSMAQFFCNKGDLEFIEHDPSDVRLHQIVRNSEGFAKAFNCPLDSPMNPQKKCRLF